MLTFGNECQFEQKRCTSNAKWALVTSQECDQDTERITCDYNCPETVSHVCGINKSGKQQTFKNYCHFKNKQCQEVTKEWSLLISGKCKNPEPKNRKHYHCPARCSSHKDPICVENATGELKVFDNLCLFKKFDCNNLESTWEIVPLHKCVVKQSLNVKCKTECTAEINPVCGMDSNGNEQTFNNQCEFERESCLKPQSELKIVSKGACKEKRAICNNRCPKNYRPVCGKDQTGKLRTFPNKCTFDAVQCKERQVSWEFLSVGECVASPVSATKDCTGTKVAVSPECVGICSRDYDPICVMSSNGSMKTFVNRCEFESEKCQNRGGMYKILKEEAC